jgi:3D (Asp-Asp-Asp) domain-containing protein
MRNKKKSIINLKLSSVTALFIVFILAIIMMINPIKTDGEKEPSKENYKPLTTITTSQGVKDKVKKKTKWRNLGTFRVTYYSAGEPGVNHTTATGTTTKEGRTLAVDPTIIPYGAVVKVGDKIYIAEDCGGMIKGKKVDIYLESIAECEERGVDYMSVKVKKESQKES